MRILFLARHANYFKNFESVVRGLAERGHAVHLAVERGEAIGGSALLDRVAAECPTVVVGEAPPREHDTWGALAVKIRLALDLTRYLDPAYDGTPRLRTRAAERAPAFAVRFAESRWARWRPARALFQTLLRRAEVSLPPSSRIAHYLRDMRPDAVVITPLIGVVGSSQPDYLREARRAGIPTAVAVWSWDHLTSKALIRDLPDRVIVWNETQRDEAVRLHGVPVERVAVTGAQCFDHWFARRASRPRAEFCGTVGLPADRPFLLYVGSALFGGSPSEAVFALRWAATIRASIDPVVRSAGILIRPHPQRMREWDGVDLSPFQDVVIRGANPVTEAARADYYDTLSHCQVVVGLNTSAFLEAAIVGRPVLAIQPDEFRDNQEGTLHFRYLSTVGGGLVRTSRTLAEHEGQLREAMASPAEAGRHVRFLTAFLRPHGLDREATPIFVETVESLTAIGPSQAPVPAGSLVGRWVLAVMRRAGDSRRWAAWLLDEEGRRTQAWRETKAEARAARRRAGVDPAAQAEAERAMRARRKTS